MSLYKQFLNEEYGVLTEKLITFAGEAYPKFGNVIVMAGGAGSGKGFVIKHLVGAEGYTFDVDALKTLAAKADGIAKKVKDELGVDMAELSANLKNPENVSKLHEIISMHLNLDDKKLKAIYASILTAAPDRKPNLIFDVTLKDLHKFDNLTRQVRALGYENEKIHIVWVVNDIEVAIKQNAARSRTVPVEILVNTHRGVSATMHDIFNMGNQLKKYMDGDIVIAFNKEKVDAELVKGDKKDNVAFPSRKASAGAYVANANYFYVKRSGKDVIPLDQMTKDIKAKIASYVPAGVVWEGVDQEDVDPDAADVLDPEKVEKIEEAVKFVKDPVNKDPQFDRFFVLKDNKPLGYVEVTGVEHAVFSPDGKFLGHKVGKKEALKTLEGLKEGVIHFDKEQHSYTVWKKDLNTGKLSHKEHLNNEAEVDEWMEKAYGKHVSVLVKQDKSGKEVTYTDNGEKFVAINKKK